MSAEGSRTIELCWGLAGSAGEEGTNVDRRVHMHLLYLGTPYEPDFPWWVAILGILAPEEGFDAPHLLIRASSSHATPLSRRPGPQGKALGNLPTIVA